MRRLGSILLLMVLAVSMFALVGINKPASAVTGVGSHQFIVRYLKARITALQDPYLRDPAPDEWSFVLIGRSIKERTDSVNKTVSETGDYSLGHLIQFPKPRVVYPSLDWYVTGDTHFNLTAVEWYDPGIGKPAVQYSSQARVDVPFPSSSTPVNSWINGATGEGGNPIDYYEYYISNSAPSATIETSSPCFTKGVPFGFKGSGVDPEGDAITSYYWDFGDGGTSTSQNPTHTYANYGTYTVKFRVTDYFGAYTEKTTTVSSQDKVQVTLSTASDTVEAGTNASVTYTATYQPSGEKFDGTVTLNDIDFKKFTVGTFYYTTQSITGGVYGITAFQTNTLAIKFIDTTAPTAEAGPDQTVNEDTEVTLDGSASSDNLPQGVNSGIKSYKWTFADVTLDGQKPTHTFDTPGVYPITLNVTDAGGNSNTDTVVITVLDVTPPIASAGQDQTVNAGTAVTFNASDSSDNVDIISYEWNFGDNTVGTGKTTDHTYANAGTYTVTLTVKDAAGNSATHSIIVTVQSAQGPPALPGGQGFSMWMVGAVVAIAAVAVAALLLLRKRKKPPTQTSTPKLKQS